MIFFRNHPPVICLLFFGLVLPLVAHQSCYAATYYVDGSAVDDGGNGSSGSPKKYITSGLTLMSGGDTLIIKDGVYTGQNNMIGDYADPRVFPPSGTVSQYTTLKAENIGGAIIDAEYLRYAFSNFNSSKINYLRIEGIHFRRGEGGVFNLMGDNNKVIKCGFEDGMAANTDSEAPIAFIAGGSSNTLVEDSWVWGKGRYGLYTNSTAGGTNNIIFRRVVIRLDDAPDNWVCAGTRFYNSDTNSAQNVLVVDSEPVGCSFYEGAFAMGGGSSSGEPNHSYTGILALNNINWPAFLPDKSRQVTTIENAVFWKNDGHGLGVVPTSEGIINLNHITAGKNTLSGYRSNSGYTAVTENVSNAISYHNGRYGFESIDSVERVNVFANTMGACMNCNAGNGSLATNPLLSANNNASAALKYLVRIENGSNLKGAATDSGDIGANILKRIGASESLHSDPDWNQVTVSNLWPWPDEDIWVPKMRGYTASGSGGNRGFAADGQTLTNYIWGYFNYDGDPGTPNVTVPPFGVKALAGENKIILKWNPPAPIALPTITGFKVYDVTGINDPVVPSMGSLVATINDNSTYFETISGLTNGQNYDFVITAVGTAGESGFSYKVSSTPVSLEILSPSIVTGFYINLANKDDIFIINGHAPSDSNVEVFINGLTRSVGNTTADINGSWMLGVDLAALSLSEGEILFTAVSGGGASSAVVGLYDVTAPDQPSGVSVK